MVLGSKRISESAGGIERSIADARAGMQQIATAAEESSHATGEAATAARQQSSSTSSWHPQLKILPPLPMNFNQSD